MVLISMGYLNIIYSPDRKKYIYINKNRTNSYMLVFNILVIVLKLFFHADKINVFKQF